METMAGTWIDTEDNQRVDNTIFDEYLDRIERKNSYF